MSRRFQRTEQSFGSDSFLDVIANIVGILIILIVIVGMKVARQPVAAVPQNLPTAEISITLAEPAQEEPAADLTVPVPPTEETTEAAEEQSARLAAKDAERTELAGELELQSAQLQQLQRTAAELAESTKQLSGDQELNTLNLAALRQQHAEQIRNSAELEAEKAALLQAVARQETELRQEESELQQVAQAVDRAESLQSQNDQTLQRVNFETLRLQETLNQLAATAAPVDRLQHRLSPVAETVEEGELHFRVENHRVSHVPIQELLERLKAQVQARRSAVTRFTRYEGSVGPVAGYRMSYTVERDSMSQLQSLQYGTGTWRISVSRWTILPDSELAAETIEEAVRPGSQFRQHVELANPGSAVTFWIYPESFARFAELREICHGLQLRVAARPLPTGTPIVGSPGGSRSTAQ